MAAVAVAAGAAPWQPGPWLTRRGCPSGPTGPPAPEKARGRRGGGARPEEPKKKGKKDKREKEKKERKKSKEEKRRKKHKQEREEEPEEATPTVPGQSEELIEVEALPLPRLQRYETSDVDFWLSSAAAPPETQEAEPAAAAPDSAPAAAPASEPEEESKDTEPEETKSSKHKKKKQKKEKEEKDKKKKKKHHHHHHHRHHGDEGGDESVQNGTVEEEEPLPPMSNYSLLAENSYIKMMCDIQGNLQDGSQVVVSVIFENKCDSFLKSMEFNVLDSLNTKLQRPEGAGPHDALTVPFQLPPGVSNARVFSVQSITPRAEGNAGLPSRLPSGSIIMPQKLKGTLAFIVKSEESSTHEKLDFKLHFTCSSYLITTPCYSDAFAKLLESGS
ncbi:hypothetical protein COCON_G00087740 [Conger conger]|uniref:Uncharacterized protein n=1 Tax=Conger conger TaxID=82655 RepID=A0A9Q1DKG3_CONCO|nr:hypothetical protein COCON_G00087740 [Conger conger]